MENSPKLLSQEEIIELLMTFKRETKRTVPARNCRPERHDVPFLVFECHKRALCSNPNSKVLCQKSFCYSNPFNNFRNFPVFGNQKSVSRAVSFFHTVQESYRLTAEISDETSHQARESDSGTSEADHHENFASLVCRRIWDSPILQVRCTAIANNDQHDNFSLRWDYRRKDRRRNMKYCRGAIMHYCWTCKVSNYVRVFDVHMPDVTLYGNGILWTASKAKMPLLVASLLTAPFSEVCESYISNETRLISHQFRISGFWRMYFYFSSRTCANELCTNFVMVVLLTRELQTCLKFLISVVTVVISTSKHAIWSILLQLWKQEIGIENWPKNWPKNCRDIHSASLLSLIIGKKVRNTATSIGHVTTSL